MKRSDLINYLQMLCTTEYASYTCHNIIDKLEVIQNDYLKSRNQNYDDWRNANLRKQKQYNQYVYPLWDNHYGFYCGIIVSVVVLIFGITRFFSSPDHNISSIFSDIDLLSIFISIVVLFIAWSYFTFFLGFIFTIIGNAISFVIQKLQKTCYVSNHRRLRKKNASLIEQFSLTEADTVLILRDTLRTLKAKQKALDELREALYFHGELEQDYRNMFVLYQLREYIVRGYCDTLESAYKIFQKEVSVQRFCALASELGEKTPMDVPLLNFVLLQYIDDIYKANYPTLLASIVQQLNNINDCIIHAQYTLLNNSKECLDRLNTYRNALLQALNNADYDALIDSTIRSVNKYLYNEDY